MNEAVITKISQVIDERVRPILQGHHGDIEIVSLEDGILRIKMTGQCYGCPSAQITVEDVVKATVMEEVPEVSDVVLFNELSPELMEIARKYLGGKE